MTQLYDAIGIDYRNYRRPDARIATAIRHALGDTDTVVNVGAGTGSYEPEDRLVVAVEPSMVMIRQRRAGSAPVVQASATHLPFRDASFAAALAVLTVHHWPDRPRGLDEMARVAGYRLVLLTWDPATTGFWLIEDYFPEIVEIDRQIMPSIEAFRHAWGHIEVRRRRLSRQRAFACSASPTSRADHTGCRSWRTAYSASSTSLRAPVFSRMRAR